MHRHCPHCDHTIPSAGYARHLQEAHGKRRNGSTGEHRRLRVVVFERDGDRCTVCGATENLELAHLDWNWRNNDLANLACRCRQHNPRGDEFTLDRTPAVGGRLT